MESPSGPVPPPEPSASAPTQGRGPASGVPPDPPAAAPPARAGLIPIVAIAAAVCGGAVVTLLVMTAKPAATPAPAAAKPPAASAGRAARPFAPSPAGPAWSTTHRGRWVSNHRKAAAFEVAADRPVGVWMKQVTPLLVVRCLDRRTDVFVFTDSAARIEPQDDNHTVQIALDGAPPATERWPDSVEHDALFAPDGAALARQLVQADTMTFGFTPHNAAPVLATFNVRGLGERMKQVEDFCN
jgi:hypothetical protein